MEGGAFQSRKLAKASRDYVFVFLHQTREDSCASYKLMTEEYLGETFLHPVYFFLRPDGVEAVEGDRYHHLALSAQKIQKNLDGIAKEWGKGLEREDYLQALEAIARAEALFAGGDWDKARRALSGVAALRARCGVKDRAKAYLGILESLEEILAAWRAAEGVPEDLRSAVEERLVAGDFPGSWRAIRGRRGSAKIEPVSAIREKIEEVLLERVRLNPVRLERIDLKGRTYWVLRSEWETDLPVFDGLAIQLSYLTERKRTHECYAVLDDVAPFRRHRAGCCLDSRQLRLADVVNVRAELWLDDLPLHVSLWKKEPAEFFADRGQVIFGPDLLEPHESLAAGGRYKIREIRLGRYPGAE